MLISAFGHIVRLQAITKDGLVVDDPYGKVVNSRNQVTPKYKKDEKIIEMIKILLIKKERTMFGNGPEPIHQQFEN